MDNVIKLQTADVSNWLRIEDSIRRHIAKYGIAGAAGKRVCEKLKLIYDTMPHPSADVPAGVAPEIQQYIEPMKANLAALLAQIVSLCVVAELEGYGDLKEVNTAPRRALATVAAVEFEHPAKTTIEARAWQPGLEAQP